MASACALEWAPDSMYNTAVSAIVASYYRHRREIKGLPSDVQFDIYYKVGFSPRNSSTINVNKLNKN